MVMDSNDTNTKAIETETISTEPTAAPGWYQLADGRSMYFNGTAWEPDKPLPITENAARAARATAPTPPVTVNVGRGSADPWVIGHIVCFLITLFTCGLFFPVWLVMIIAHVVAAFTGNA